MRCALAPGEVRAAVAAAFRAKAQGEARTLPGIATPAGAGAFHAKGGVTGKYAALKWFGYHPANRAVDLAALLSGAAEGRRLAEDRSGFPFSGSGLADAAVAALAYERAQALGLGRTLVL